MKPIRTAGWPYTQRIRFIRAHAHFEIGDEMDWHAGAAEELVHAGAAEYVTDDKRDKRKGR